MHLRHIHAGTNLTGLTAFLPANLGHLNGSKCWRRWAFFCRLKLILALALVRVVLAARCLYRDLPHLALGCEDCLCRLTSRRMRREPALRPSSYGMAQVHRGHFHHTGPAGSSLIMEGSSPPSNPEGGLALVVCPEVPMQAPLGFERVLAWFAPGAKSAANEATLALLEEPRPARESSLTSQAIFRKELDVERVLDDLVLEGSVEIDQIKCLIMRSPLGCDGGCL